MSGKKQRADPFSRTLYPRFFCPAKRGRPLRIQSKMERGPVLYKGGRTGESTRSLGVLEVTIVVVLYDEKERFKNAENSTG